MRSCIALDARDDGPSNITYVLKGVFPTDFVHRAHLFVAGSNRVEAIPTVEGIEFRSVTVQALKDKQSILHPSKKNKEQRDD